MTSEQNHQLLIMRHAKSDWGAEYAQDFDRPLNPRGIKSAKAMAKWLRNKGLTPDLIVSSPARRAEQTATLVLKGMNLDPAMITRDERIYEARPGDLLKVIDTYREGVLRMLLVGHNPGLDSLVQYLSKHQPQTALSGKTHDHSRDCRTGLRCGYDLYTRRIRDIG
jgi:phosphohistidine phosphatase